ncbi:MAG: ferrous iron transport protein A [Clostridiaceae bacterium]|jgi:ferrous iron transport protein A|nr:ferrous iron transport protein A [Clostridiaceae bacterium]
MTLDEAKRGDQIEIIYIKDALVRSQAIRLGISEGSRMLCTEIVPHGPIVLKNRKQEVAIGQKIAHKIKVERVG